MGKPWAPRTSGSAKQSQCALAAIWRAQPTLQDGRSPDAPNKANPRDRRTRMAAMRNKANWHGSNWCEVLYRRGVTIVWWMLETKPMCPAGQMVGTAHPTGRAQGQMRQTKPISATAGLRRSPCETKPTERAAVVCGVCKDIRGNALRRHYERGRSAKQSQFPRADLTIMSWALHRGWGCGRMLGL